MRRKNNFVRRWQAADLLEMIDCPYQPGNLKITKKACLKRRKASTTSYPLPIIHNEFFLYTVRQGLLTCKSCPVVETFNNANTTAELHGLKFRSV